MVVDENNKDTYKNDRSSGLFRKRKKKKGGKENKNENDTFSFVCKRTILGVGAGEK